MTVCRRVMEPPAKLDMFVYTKYLLAAGVISKLLPDAWPQLLSVYDYFVTHFVITVRLAVGLSSYTVVLNSSWVQGWIVRIGSLDVVKTTYQGFSCFMFILNLFLCVSDAVVILVFVWFSVVPV